MQKFGVDTNADIARTLAMFGGFTEGLQLFASFAMLMNFPRFNKMKGMGQIVSWSVRDESLHCEGIVKLYHAFNAETGAVTKSVADDIVDCCKTVVGLEDRFIDLAFEAGEVQGMTPDDIKTYIRFIADWRLRQLAPAGGLRREGKPPALAAEPALGRRARQLLRGPGDGVLQGRHPRRLARRGRRVVGVRQAHRQTQGRRRRRNRCGCAPALPLIQRASRNCRAGRLTSGA